MTVVKRECASAKSLRRDLTPGAGVGGIGQSKERILENLSTFPRENQENEIDINI